MSDSPLQQDRLRHVLARMANRATQLEERLARNNGENDSQSSSSKWKRKFSELAPTLILSLPPPKRYSIMPRPALEETKEKEEDEAKKPDSSSTTEGSTKDDDSSKADSVVKLPEGTSNGDVDTNPDTSETAAATTGTSNVDESTSETKETGAEKSIPAESQGQVPTTKAEEVGDTDVKMEDVTTSGDGDAQEQVEPTTEDSKPSAEAPAETSTATKEASSSEKEEEDSAKKTPVVTTDETVDTAVAPAAAAAAAAAGDDDDDDDIDSSNMDDIGSEWWYKQQIDETKQEIKHINDQKKQFYKKQLELWGIYRYGLQTISTISDLSDAPDAILPGNF